MPGANGQRGGQTERMRDLASKFRRDSSQMKDLIRGLDSDTSNS